MRIFLFLLLISCSSEKSENSKFDAGYSRAVDSKENDASFSDGGSFEESSNCRIIEQTKLDCIVRQRVCWLDGQYTVTEFSINCPKDSFDFPWDGLPDPPPPRKEGL